MKIYKAFITNPLDYHKIRDKTGLSIMNLSRIYSSKTILAIDCDEAVNLFLEHLNSLEISKMLKMTFMSNDIKVNDIPAIIL
jgi:hypothetical protein